MDVVTQTVIGLMRLLSVMGVASVVIVIAIMSLDYEKVIFQGRFRTTARILLGSMLVALLLMLAYNIGGLK